MSNVRFALTSRLTALSHAKTWDQAVTEWELFDWYDQPGSSCLCGKTNIRYMSVLRNTITANVIDVGSECVVTITSHRPDLIYTAVNRVREDIKERLNKEAIEFYAKKGVIDEKSAKFYTEKRRKRNLSEKQEKWVRNLNATVLHYVAQQNAIRVPTLQKAIEIAMQPAHYLPRSVFSVSQDKRSFTTEYSDVQHSGAVPEVRYVEEMKADRPVYAIKSEKTGAVVEFVLSERRMTKDNELECDIFRPVTRDHAHLTLTIYND